MRKTMEDVVSNKVKRKSGGKDGNGINAIKKKVVVREKTVWVDIEKLAMAMAVNHADWPAYTGRAERVAQALPGIIEIEKSLFN